MSNKKSVPLKANLVAMVKSTKLPAVRARTAWRDFDDHVRVAETMVARFAGLMLTLEREPFSLSSAKIEASWRSGTMAFVREFDEGREFFERDELYETTKKMQPDLLECWSDRVITRRVVGEQIGVLLGGFPNSSPHNAEVYTRVLIEEIIAAKPCASALEATMRHIRRNSVFAPSPAEMLKVLREKMEMWNDYVETSCNLSYWYDVLDKKIAEAEAKRTRGP